MEEYHSHDYTRSTCFYTQPWKNLFKDFNLEMEWEVTSAIIHNEIWTVPCFKGVWVDFFHSVFSFSSSRLFIFFILSFYTDGFPSFASLLLSFLSFFYSIFSNTHFFFPQWFSSLNSPECFFMHMLWKVSCTGYNNNNVEMTWNISNMSILTGWHQIFGRSHQVTLTVLVDSLKYLL